MGHITARSASFKRPRSMPPGGVGQTDNVIVQVEVMVTDQSQSQASVGEEEGKGKQVGRELSDETDTGVEEVNGRSTGLSDTGEDRLLLLLVLLL